MIFSGCGSYRKGTYNYDAWKAINYVHCGHGDGLIEFQMSKDKWHFVGDKLILITQSS